MSEHDEIAIKVSHVSKHFKLPHESQNSLKGRVINFRKRGYELQQALNDISFEVKKGEFLGIVGRNGSGKSTLLKILAGIYAPNKGHVKINGKLTPFIELGVGFNPELSGRDNVYLNGALLGFNRKEMDEMYRDIVDFAELERFMDQKLKNYSSGMQVRLAFSIAIRARTDILVLDEVLAVGDANFQKKCANYFRQLKQQKKTVILVSHSMGDVRGYCDRAILINDSKIYAEGDPSYIANEYMELNRQAMEKEVETINKKHQADLEQPGKHDMPLQIERVWSTDAKGKETTIFEPHEPVYLNCSIIAHEDAKEPIVVLKSHNPNGPPIFAVTTKGHDIDLDLKAGQKVHIRWRTEGIFNDGTYFVNAAIIDKKTGVKHDELIDSFRYEVSGWESPAEITHITSKPEIIK